MLQGKLLICCLFVLFAVRAGEFSLLENKIKKEKDYQAFAMLHHDLNQVGYELYQQKYQEAVELRVFSYNAGFLNMALIKVPEYKDRVKFFKATLDGVDFDILCLQEIWNDRERQELQQIASERNYFLYHGSKKNYERHGLVILINKAIAREVHFDEYIYDKQAWYEPVSGYVKGALRAHITLLNGRTMLLVNTHLTAVANGIRDKQAQEIIKNFQIEADYFLLTGDFNNNPFMKEQVYWPLVQHFKMLDTFLAQNPQEEGATYDQVTNPVATKASPGGNDSSERIDYVLIGRGNAEVAYHVQDSGLIFTDDLPIEKCSISVDGQQLPCKLSDHYGVGAWLYLF